MRGEESAEGPEDIGYDRTTGHHDSSYERNKNVATIEDIPEDEFEGKMKPTSEILLWYCRLGHPKQSHWTDRKPDVLRERHSDGSQTLPPVRVSRLCFK